MSFLINIIGNSNAGKDSAKKIITQKYGKDNIVSLSFVRPFKQLLEYGNQLPIGALDSQENKNKVIKDIYEKDTTLTYQSLLINAYHFFHDSGLGDPNLFCKILKRTIKEHYKFNKNYLISDCRSQTDVETLLLVSKELELPLHILHITRCGEIANSSDCNLSENFNTFQQAIKSKKIVGTVKSYCNNKPFKYFQTYLLNYYESLLKYENRKIPTPS